MDNLTNRRENFARISKRAFAFAIGLALIGTTLPSMSCTAQEAFQKVEFSGVDQVTITADLYAANKDASTPFIVLCHQANWSRGEYREIAPKLNKLGFNCLAIDQRSGGEVNGVSNQTLANAKKSGKPTTYVDAEQDIIAALNYAKEKHATGKLILWGSSYSAALSLKIAGDHPDLIDGVLSFAPGEYFGTLGKSGDWIQTSAANIKAPTFITSARQEKKNWSAIYNAIESDKKVKFLPKSKGNHGSRALWEKFDDHGVYWVAVKAFLEQFNAQDQAK